MTAKPSWPSVGHQLQASMPTTATVFTRRNIIEPVLTVEAMNFTGAYSGRAMNTLTMEYSLQQATRKEAVRKV